MARLRKPSAAEPPIFIPPTTTSKPTRASPRKTIRESPSNRELRYTSSQDPGDSFLVPKAPASDSPVRKQRVLRPVASNSRLLRKLSNESLATPDRRGRRSERERNSQLSYFYSKTLAKSVARKQGKGRKIELGVEVEQETVLDEGIEEVEKSIMCGDEKGNEENIREVEEEETDEDEEPVVAVRMRRLQRPARRMVSDTEEDEDENEQVAIKSRSRNTSAQEAVPKPSTEMPPPLTSLRLPFRKGHSTISNWAQEVIDLTSSPEPPASFVLPPPTRVRTASFAASCRPTSSASADVAAMLHLYASFQNKEDKDKTNKAQLSHSHQTSLATKSTSGVPSQHSSPTTQPFQACLSLEEEPTHTPRS